MRHFKRYWFLDPNLTLHNLDVPRIVILDIYKRAGSE